MFDALLQPIYTPLMVTDNAHYWERFGCFGGHVFLDFINTIDDIDKARSLEGIESWKILLRWTLAAKVVSESEMIGLADVFTEKEAQLELDKLHGLRELAWRILNSAAANRSPDSEDLSILSNEIRWAYTQATLSRVDEGFHWDTKFQQPKLTLIRARLGLAADNLLSNKSLKITECGSCTGLFLNTGRGLGRKWCRMQSCGNRAKVNKFRAQ